LLDIVLIYSSLFSVLLLGISTPVPGAELHLALADSTCSVMHEAEDAFARQTGIPLSYTCNGRDLKIPGLSQGERGQENL